MTLRFVSFVVALLGLALPHAAAAESQMEQEIRLFTEMLELAPGKVVADIGAGEGQYGFALAEVVGAEGKVYATELDDEKLTALTEAVAEQGLANVEVVKGAYASTALPAASVDAAFLRDVYHHITEPEKFLESLFETIRPGGRLVLVDFPPTIWLALFTPEGIPESRGGHGITTELLVSEAKAAGFVPLRTVEEWPSNNFITRTYGVAFERPGPAPEATPPSGSPE